MTSWRNYELLLTQPDRLFSCSCEPRETSTRVIPTDVRGLLARLRYFKNLAS